MTYNSHITQPHPQFSKTSFTMIVKLMPPHQDLTKTMKKVIVVVFARLAHQHDHSFIFQSSGSTRPVAS
jgi:hypothetical protein